MFDNFLKWLINVHTFGLAPLTSFHLWIMGFQFRFLTLKCSVLCRIHLDYALHEVFS